MSNYSRSYSDYLGSKRCCSLDLSKSVVGERGPQGNPGPIGPVGATGATGPAGASAMGVIGPFNRQKAGDMIFRGPELQGEDLLLGQGLYVMGNVNFSLDSLENKAYFIIKNLSNFDPKIEGAVYKDENNFLKVSNG